MVAKVKGNPGNIWHTYVCRFQCTFVCIDDAAVSRARKRWRFLRCYHRCHYPQYPLKQQSLLQQPLSADPQRAPGGGRSVLAENIVLAACRPPSLFFSFIATRARRHGILCCQRQAPSYDGWSSSLTAGCNAVSDRARPVPCFLAGSLRSFLSLVLKANIARKRKRLACSFSGRYIYGRLATEQPFA